ncbi:hypothetical protein BZG36_02899 [Bifiguratus adelaidae]|uniref:tRNA:m(4)X modification enzyme TRM13 n=1 Tax=Bifiguratus adelaidae TaxID=1938954 RepID=A0A261Y1G9_9FUNG|nr:hypothetical protein BZG36_02899 [Bifiguratus adelaidae]
MDCKFAYYVKRQQRWKRCSMKASITPDNPPETALCPHHLKHPEILDSFQTPKASKAQKDMDQPDEDQQHAPPERIELEHVPKYLVDRIQTLLDQDLQGYPPQREPEPHPSYTTLFPQAAAHKQKHLRQESGMLRLLSERHLLPTERHAVIEFGAGKAGFARHYQLVTAPTPLDIYLIDRLTFRSTNRFDRALQAGGATVTRIVGNIEDMQINVQGPIMCLAKHACGSATDATLQWMQRYKGKIRMALAPCCHSLCTWDTYTGQEAFKTWFKDPDALFKWTCRLSSWATLSDTLAQRLVKQVAAPEVVLDPRRVLDLTQLQDRIELGRRCKYLIDFGRVLGSGMQVDMIEFTDQTVENKVLIGWRP